MSVGTPSYFKESSSLFKFSTRRVDRPVDNAMNNLGDRLQACDRTQCSKCRHVISWLDPHAY